MKRSEMNRQQLDTFHYILNALQDKGWHYDGDISWFEKDLWEEPEIGMVYENPSMLLLLEYTLTKEPITLVLTSNRSGKEIIFDIFPGDNLSACLAYLTANQDSITPSSYKKHMVSLLSICPGIFTYKDNVPHRLEP